MDVSTHKFFQSQSVLASLGELVPTESSMSSLYGKNKDNSNSNNDNPLTILDVSAQRREHQQRRVVLEALATPGRLVFSFTTIGRNLSRKIIPSNWDDAEKWVMSSSCRESPAHVNAVNV
ncbi:hypothetical protein PIB30_056701 [Stylosanthes scabra]|uniref:Uncharacterized protein n=1 Tax=Stylosanthes scabra TaxID=79078 RepID=A0ABU6SJG2_9FABA|nr:hypothetical protein [Stylosanthes scabra]